MRRRRSILTPPSQSRGPRRRRRPASCRCSPTPSPTPTARPPPRPRTRRPPGAPPWSLVVLSFSVAVAGDQYDRVAAVWLDGAELLRTTTAEPTPDGVRWAVRKDVTRYPALLRSPPGGVLSVMLENLVNDVYTGIYVSVSLEFHGAPAYLGDAGPSSAAGPGDPGHATPKLPASYFQPADLILPISESTGNTSGFWFRIQNSSDSRSKLVELGAFDLPTYDVELTPFLGLLVDGKAHEVALSVVDGIAEWLVDANLHLWLDPSSPDVSAALGRYRTPRLSITRRYRTGRPLDGRFTIRAKRKSRFSGWVTSSFGNFTTEVEAELEATSLVEFTDRGRNKTVRLQAEQDTRVVVRSSETRRAVGKVGTEARYPLWLEMVTESEDGEDGAYVMRANLTHALSVETGAEAEGMLGREARVADEQAAAGWMLVRDHDVLNGSAATAQAYRFSDGARRYERAIDTLDGAVLSDNVTESCYRTLRDGLGIAARQAGGRAMES